MPDEQKRESSVNPPRAPDPQCSQPSSSRIVRRRRPTAIPSESSSKNEVTLLRPSEVPQREPLPEYKDPNVNRRIVPKDVPLERLNEYHIDDCCNVTIPLFMPSEDLLTEANRVNGLVSFRSTNFVDPSDILNEMNQKETRAAKILEQAKHEEIDEASDGGEAIEDDLVSDETDELLELYEEFMARNRHLVGQKVYGCTTRIEADNLSLWFVEMEAPRGSIFEGGTFFISINMKPQQGFLVPSVRFKTLILHPNLSRIGSWDLRGIWNDWGRKSTLDVVYRHLMTEMQDLKYNIQRKTLDQIEDMSQPNIARLAYENWNKFEEMARMLVRKMAGGSLQNSRTVEAKMGCVYSSQRGWADRETSDEVIDVVGF